MTTRSHHAKEHPLRTGRPPDPFLPERMPRDCLVSIKGSILIDAGDDEKFRALNALRPLCRTLGLAIVEADGATRRRRWSTYRITRRAAMQPIIKNPGIAFNTWARLYLLGMPENDATVRYARQRARVMLARFLDDGWVTKRYDPVTGEVLLDPPDPHYVSKFPELFCEPEVKRDVDGNILEFPPDDEPFDMRDAWKYPDAFAMGEPSPEDRALLRKLGTTSVHALSSEPFRDANGNKPLPPIDETLSLDALAAKYPDVFDPESPLVADPFDSHDACRYPDIVAMEYSKKREDFLFRKLREWQLERLETVDKPVGDAI